VRCNSGRVGERIDELSTRFSERSDRSVLSHHRDFLATRHDITSFPRSTLIYFSRPTLTTLHVHALWIDQTRTQFPLTSSRCPKQQPLFAWPHPLHANLLASLCAVPSEEISCKIMPASEPVQQLSDSSELLSTMRIRRFLSNMNPISGLSRRRTSLCNYSDTMLACPLVF